MTRSQIVLLISFAARIVIAILVTAYLGRVLDADAFGFFALVAAVLAVAAPLVDFGTQSMAVREIARDPGVERPLLEGLMAWRSICGAGLGLAILAFALFETDPTRRGVLLGLAVLLGLMAPGALEAVFISRQAHTRVAILGTLNHTLMFLGLVALGTWRVDGPLFVWALLVREVVALVVIGALAVRLLGYLPRPGLRGRRIRPFLARAAVLGLASFARAFTLYGDVFVVRLLRGEADLGAYAAALRPVNVVLLAPAVFTVPLLPVLAAAATANRARFVLLARSGGALLGGLGLIAAVTGVILAPELLALLYGDRFGAETVGALRWLCGAVAMTFLSAPYLIGLLADGRERLLLVLGVTVLVLNLAGNFLLVPWYGIPAAGAVTAATEACLLLAAIVAFHRRDRRTGPRLPDLVAYAPAAGLAVFLLALGVAPLAPGVRTVTGLAGAAFAAVVLLNLPPAKRFRAELATGPSVSPTDPGGAPRSA